MELLLEIFLATSFFLCSLKLIKIFRSGIAWELHTLSYDKLSPIAYIGYSYDKDELSGFFDLQKATLLRLDKRWEYNLPFRSTIAHERYFIEHWYHPYSDIGPRAFRLRHRLTAKRINRDSDKMNEIVYKNNISYVSILNSNRIGLTYINTKSRGESKNYPFFNVTKNNRRTIEMKHYGGSTLKKRIFSVNKGEIKSYEMFYKQNGSRFILGNRGYNLAHKNIFPELFPIFLHQRKDPKFLTPRDTRNLDNAWYDWNDVSSWKYSAWNDNLYPKHNTKVLKEVRWRFNEKLSYSHDNKPQAFAALDQTLEVEPKDAWYAFTEFERRMGLPIYSPPWPVVIAE